MIKIVAILILITLLSCGCHSKISLGENDTVSAYGGCEAFGYNYVLFDSDGDGNKNDIAVLTALDMFGGYGQHRLEVYLEFDREHKRFLIQVPM